jgi:cellulose synthase/poly-beta-1,6-N-acetylglucosamine synthase-like glycosyltransferase
MFLIFLTVLVLLLYALLIFYYWREWNRLPYYHASGSSHKKFISVLVPARNEEKNIAFLLQSLSQQTYPKEFFEIIVINDFSTDRTAEIVSNFSLPNLFLIEPATEAKSSSKKKAIETGIRKAKGELIVTTDADCLLHKDWLNIINDFYAKKEAAFIAAPVKFSHDNSLLQLFQSLDFLTLQGITAASVAGNFHTMCNGANLTYQKQAFENVNGFEGIDKVATGDDMLLMHKIWKQYPNSVFYLKNREAIVTSVPMHSWRTLFMQRKRWASKTLVYDDYRIIAVLFFVYLLNCWFVVLILASLFNTHYWWYTAGFWIAKTIIELPFVYSVARFYEEQRLIKFLFFFQPLHIFYTVFIGLISQFGKYEWKGRKTK